LYFCIILHSEILPGGLLMPSPPLAASRLVWILALPVHTPVSSTLGAPLSTETFGCVIGASFGAGGLPLPLCYMYYRYISGSAALWESPREREVRACAPRNVTQVLPYGQSRVPRNLRQDASWEHLPLPLLLCPPRWGPGDATIDSYLREFQPDGPVVGFKRHPLQLVHHPFLYPLLATAP
jgi:hypothetical protein